MNVASQIRYLQVQLLDTERMLHMVEGHPIMSFQLRQKLATLQQELERLPKDSVAAEVSFKFSGSAVSGSEGIKSSFVGKTLSPIQELVKTEAALVRFGKVSKRGTAKNAAESELYLTGLKRGSFGFELKQMKTNDLFDERDVAVAIQNVIRLIQAAAENDNVFEEAIARIPKRSLSNLHKFLKEVSDEKSFLEIESGSTLVEFSAEDIREAYHRVADAEAEEEHLYLEGILRGFLLDSGRFEITDENGNQYTGFISEDLSEEQIIEFDKRFLNQRCGVHLLQVTTRFRTGRERKQFELQSIVPPGPTVQE